MNPLYQIPQQSKKRIQAWKELVKMYEQEDLSLSKFCQEQGVNTRTFTKWKRKFGAEKKKPFDESWKAEGRDEEPAVAAAFLQNGMPKEW